MKNGTKFYIRVMIAKPGISKRWLTIGNATETEKGIAGTIHSIPLPPWNGEFMMFPHVNAPADDLDFPSVREEIDD